MDVQLIVDRGMLRRLLQTQPDWTVTQYADAVGRSRRWVKTWRHRLRAAAPDDTRVLLDRCHARHTPQPPLHPLVVNRILAIRDTPPPPLQRIPGPKTIVYYLGQDPDVRALDQPVPGATTVWRVLRQHDRIAPPYERHQRPLARPAPMLSWQLDFKDPALPVTDPAGKQQHVVEILNTVDVGTSLWVDQQARPDFTMATTIAAVADLVEREGLPAHVNVDRDPRFVGSQLPRDVPSPFLRFWMSCGVAITLSPPRHPETNAFVERLHRTLSEECLRPHRPSDLETLQTVVGDFQQFYNEARPHQGLSCANQPPRIAFPDLKPCPRAPADVDPDRWVHVLDGKHYTRRIGSSGSVQFDRHDYYVRRLLAGHVVDIQIDGRQRQLVISQNGQVIKQLPIKGLVGHTLPFAAFVERLEAEAGQHDRLQHYRLVGSAGTAGC